MSTLIKRNGSPYWQIRFTHPLTRKSSYKSTKTSDRRIALVKKRDFDKKMSHGSVVKTIGTKRILEEIAEKYLEWSKERRSKKWTYEIKRIISNENIKNTSIAIFE